MGSIKKWYVTGDTHGMVGERISEIFYQRPDFYADESALIILGDAGLNYYGKKNDRRRKRHASSFGTMIYCVRGNHEIRPEDVDGMKLMYDDNVGGEVYVEDEFPLIRYFMDGGVYDILGKNVLVIGGAYSVDKFYRIERAKATNSNPFWFENEQLNQNERDEILQRVDGKHFDVVLTHTAPIKFEPTDLFIRGVDQAAVDKTMEEWLGLIEEKVDYGLWLFGHYHDDRVEAPFVEQFFGETESLDSIIRRWEAYRKTGEIKGVVRLGPKMQIFLGR